MKIVIVNYRFFLTSGAETFMFKLISLLEQKGNTVIPFSTQNEKNVPSPYESYFAKARSSDGNVLYKNIKKTPKNIIRLLSGAFYNVDAEKCLRRLLRDEKPDVMLVLQQMNALSPSVFAAARKEHVPVVHRLSDFNLLCPRYDFLRDQRPCTECIGGCFLPSVRYRCVKGSLAATCIRSMSMRYHRISGVYHSISKYIVPSSFTKELMVRGGFEADKIEHLPTFIDTTGIRHSDCAGDYFLFMGRLSEEKGISDMIRAIRLMKGDGVLKLAGTADGEYAQSLKKLAEEEGVSNRVCFMGFTSGEALNQTIRNARAILLPALWYENMPNAVLESYAYAKPVIVSRLGSLPEMVDENVTGLMCEPGNAASLAEKMDILWQNPELAMKMGKAAYQRCTTMYGPETYYKKIMKVFENAAAEGKNRK